MSDLESHEEKIAKLLETVATLETLVGKHEKRITKLAWWRTLVEIVGLAAVVGMGIAFGIEPKTVAKGIVDREVPTLVVKSVRALVPKQVEHLVPVEVAKHVPGQVKGKVHELVPILVASQANDIVPRLVDDILKSESSKATLAKIEDSRRIADSAAIEAKGRATQAEVAATAAVKELDEIRKGRSDATTSTFESISVKTLYIVGGLNGKDVVGRISSEKVSSLLPGAQREASQDVDDSKLLFDIGQNKYNGGAIVVRGTPKNEGGENAANVLKSTVLGIEIRALDDQMGFYFVDDDGKLLKYGIEWKKPKK